MYAEVIIDIKNKDVDRPFTYAVPERLAGTLSAGSCVNVPFGAGNRLRKGYIIGFSEKTDYAPDKVKEIDSVDEKAVTAEEQMIRLAAWMRDRFGGTFYQALSVTLPSKVRVEAKKERRFVFTGTDAELSEELSTARRKKHYAKQRLLEAFSEKKVLPASIVTDRLNISAATLKSFTEKGLVTIETYEKSLADRMSAEMSFTGRVKLNPEQESAVKGIISDTRTVQLLYGVTGSGKTEVYLNLIAETLKAGRSAIVLIPEIALTYQTVMRFYDRFGELVSVVHSRISKGEKCERFEKASQGKVRVMIGPRSALFAPFTDTGLIIIDEFHENSYNSDQVPKYSAIETAVKRAEMSGAKVVLGSATPLVECYEKALKGEYALHVLKERAVSGSRLPDVTVVDMRSELKNKNRSIFSAALKEKIDERLKRNEQVMLFLNRRGYSGAVSCRACGEPLCCPHCSVAMKYHQDGKMRCHFCGYERPLDKKCPFCGSSMIGSFGIGTEKVEEMVQEVFPGARTLRMDADTTSAKNGHQEILEKFAGHEADILIGTQMIVKGHDFKNVTLVGILAADLSLNVPDYRSAERTFELLTQAEGRAGRGTLHGECIVQTYNPEHYAVRTAAAQDFEGFYREEMIFRRQMRYPPAGYFMGMTLSGADRTETEEAMRSICRAVQSGDTSQVLYLGPSEALVHKVKDMYRYVLYFKTAKKEEMLKTKRLIEKTGEQVIGSRKIYMTFES